MTNGAVLYLPANIRCVEHMTNFHRKYRIPKFKKRNQGSNLEHSCTRQGQYSDLK